MKDIIDIINFLSAFLGLVGFVFFIKAQIDDAIEILGWPDKEVNFYFLSFYAFLAALLGGMFWNILNRLNETYPFMGYSPYIGGTGSEPHNIGAIIWPIATNVFVVLTLIILNYKYRLAKIKEQFSGYLAFLAGGVIGSLLFYDLPISGKVGVRNYFETLQMSFFYKEFWLVVIWSTLISVTGFVGMAIIKSITAKKSYAAIFWGLLEQIGMCVGVTTLVVSCFLLAFPEQQKFDTARGIIAGLALRMSLFFGLLIPYLSLNSIIPKSLARLIPQIRRQ